MLCHCWPVLAQLTVEWLVNVVILRPRCLRSSRSILRPVNTCLASRHTQSGARQTQSEHTHGRTLRLMTFVTVTVTVFAV